MAYKPCNRCGQDIGFRKDGGRIVPINPDGTPHHCNPAPAAQPEKENALIGIYQGITFKRISIVRKDKKILSSGCTKRLLDYLAEPGILLKVGMKVKVVFAKDGNADVIEICPDQPAAEQQQNQPGTQTETSTSPESPADIFPPKDRLIVAQCLLKAWTDLYISGHPGEAYDSKNFADARKEILAAVENDLPRVMAMGVR
ncbi:MAG: hypothetical protein M0Q92_10195 [Methanoregula sp.]|jgi:hypothetical protein|nr:hypothetical protein [Methanoregula sp.]